MTPEQPLRIRLKLDNGAEFEAEGPVELVLREKEDFLRGQRASTPAAPLAQLTDTEPPADGGGIWEQIGEFKSGLVFLKRKSQELGATEAALIIMAAAKMLAKLPECSALQLSKSLKKSGYFQGRLDRIIGSELKNGFVASAGTKRSRAYSITQKGLARAFTLAQKLANHP